MARFVEAKTGNFLHAERLKSALQVEDTRTGWTTAAPGTWLVKSLHAPRREEVWEDVPFRQHFVAMDEDARAALRQPVITVPAQPAQDAPAPPAHTAAQNLPPLQTATQFAASQAPPAPTPAPVPVVAAPPRAPENEEDLSGGLTEELPGGF